ncbi:transcriptional regulator, TetR family [Gordonia polyisoprenivorans VH2]|uniref:Transcriptional regulator, TetR family n=1 Tax=Gordonia polyisoprenivorans (strain DSM 44266 / VH2) TaxID=1112204 RepID=H6N3I7_GORPV|nr:TetR-like C-terminal domain-containing protein [Gordonia polyisoprenivorans]AFA72346.1 transcriptional regulator, TetR family [Gordonia polyisoprenivorans VH2]
MTPDRRGDNKRSAPGRPRDGRIDAAIIAATRELILETGYPALSLSAIAARAGTTTAAIYRRWSGKAQLVHEAVLSAEVMAPPTGSGDVRQDIRALVEIVRSMFNRPEVRVALPGLIADTVASPDVHARMTERLAGDLTAFESRFGQGRRDDDRLPMLAEVVAGTAIFRILIRSDAALDDTWVDEMVKLIIERWPEA